MAKAKQDSFTWPESVSVYLSEAEKDEIIETQEAFTITGADQSEHEEFGRRAEWTCFLDHEPERERIIAFGYGASPGGSAVESRDMLLMEMIEHFDRKGAPIRASLVRRGRVKLIVPVKE